MNDDEIAAPRRRVLRRGIWVWIAPRPEDDPAYLAPDKPAYTCSSCGGQTSRRETKRCLTCVTKARQRADGNTCVDCGDGISRRATRCPSCSIEARRKVTLPPLAVETPVHYPTRGSMPHGTHAAFNLHRRDGEEPCDPCVYGERIYQRHAKRRRRQEQRAGKEAA